MESHTGPRPPEPWTSPDGRFVWDGERWVATPMQRRRSGLLVLAIVAGTVTFFLGLLAVLFLAVLGPALIALSRTFGH